MSIMLLATTDLDARDGTEHNRQENEGDVDKDVRDLLLALEPLRPLWVRIRKTGESHDVADDNDNN